MKLIILGAGSIGCYVGGHLQAVDGTERELSLLGRPRMQAVVEEHGLNLTHYVQQPIRIESIDYQSNPDIVAAADVVMVTVKSQDTAAAIDSIAPYLKPDAYIISLQNGVRNVALLKQLLPHHTIYGAMVPFNVVNQGQGVFHCGTEGALMFDADTPSGLTSWLFDTAVDVQLSRDMPAVQWGKLLLNLNNALNVLSNLPLKTQLQDRHYRRVLALCIGEALAVLKQAGIKPARVGKLWPRLLPFALRLPNGIFSLLAKGLLAMDPKARSSMWEDLQAGRANELAYLNGEIVALGRQLGCATPVNQAVCDAVNRAFAEQCSPSMSGEQLLSLVQGA